MKEAKKRNRPVVGIVIGSDSDWGVMQKTASVLKQFKIPFDVTVSSAHRSPERTAEYARTEMPGRRMLPFWLHRYLL